MGRPKHLFLMLHTEPKQSAAEPARLVLQKTDGRNRGEIRVTLTPPAATRCVSFAAKISLEPDGMSLVCCAAGLDDPAAAL